MIVVGARVCVVHGQVQSLHAWLGGTARAEGFKRKGKRLEMDVAQEVSVY